GYSCSFEPLVALRERRGIVAAFLGDADFLLRDWVGAVPRRNDPACRRPPISLRAPLKATYTNTMITESATPSLEYRKVRNIARGSARLPPSAAGRPPTVRWDIAVVLA